MARALRLWLASLVLLLVLLQLASVVQAEIPRHSREIERVLASRIASLEVVLSWLEKVRLDSFRIEMEKLAEEMNFENLSRVASTLLFEVYTNASLAMDISGIELRALKKLAGLNDVLTIRDVVQLIDVVRHGLLGDSSEIPSCATVLSKTLTNIIYSTRGQSCRYNSTDLVTLLLLWFSTPRGREEQALSKNLLELLTLVEEGRSLPWNSSQYARNVVMYSSIVLGMVIYELALQGVVTTVKSAAGSVPSGVPKGGENYVAKLIELVKILEELRSMNVSISIASIRIAIRLAQEIEMNTSGGAVAEIEKLIRAAKRIVEMQRYGGTSTASISSLSRSFDEKLVSNVLREIIGGVPAVMREEVEIGSGSAMARKIRASGIGTQPVYGVQNSMSVGASGNLAEASVDPAVLDLLKHVNSVSIVEELERAEGSATSSSVAALQSSSVEEWSGYVIAMVLAAVAIPILTAYTLLRVLAAQRRLELGTSFPTSAMPIIEKAMDKLFTEFWRTVLGISRRAGIDIQRSDTHREAVSKILGVLDGRDTETLIRISRAYEAARFGRKPISDKDREQILEELQRLFERYGRGA